MTERSSIYAGPLLAVLGQLKLTGDIYISQLLLLSHAALFSQTYV